MPSIVLPLALAAVNVNVLLAATVVVAEPKLPSNVPVSSKAAVTFVAVMPLKSAPNVECKSVTATVPAPVIVLPLA